jgi:hypothetical protein
MELPREVAFTGPVIDTELQPLVQLLAPKLPGQAPVATLSVIRPVAVNFPSAPPETSGAGDCSVLAAPPPPSW